MDTNRRVGARGTSKASGRLAYAVERIYTASGGSLLSKAGTFGVALWLLNLGNVDEHGHAFKQDDAELDKLSGVHAKALAWTQGESSTDHELADLLREAGKLGRESRFIKMADNDAFIAELGRSLRLVSRKGVSQSINQLLAK